MNTKIIFAAILVILLFVIYHSRSEGATGGWTPGQAHGSVGESSGKFDRPATQPPVGPSSGGSWGGRGNWNNNYGSNWRSQMRTPYYPPRYGPVYMPPGFIQPQYGMGMYGNVGYGSQMVVVSPWQRWSQWFNPWGTRLPDCEDVNYVGPCYDGRA